jgi:hypothetical protein
VSKRIPLRALTAEEREEIRRLATSSKEPHRLVQRERVILAMLEDPDLTASQAGIQAGFKSDVMGAV